MTRHHDRIYWTNNLPNTLAAENGNSRFRPYGVAPSGVLANARCDNGGMSMALALDRAAIAQVARRYGVAELSVFGSAVSGGFDASSDVDFLVEFLPNRDDPFEDFSGLREELAQIAERDVDLVVRRAIRNPYFQESALAQAECLYVADI